jgi:hypothetical protein
MGTVRRLLIACAVLVLLAQRLAAEWCGTEVGASRGLLALHRHSRATLGPSPPGPADRDVANIAVLEDRGDLVVRRNPFDLDRRALRFAPNRAGGYDVALLALPLDESGATVPLGDDEARAFDLPFPFPYYGSPRGQVFVHSDGHLTFGSPDVGPGERGLGRFLAGPPRVAALFTDLDPGRGGSVRVALEPQRAVFAWTGIPGARQINRNSFQATLHASGEIDLVFGSEVQTREAIVGLTPGGGDDFSVVDLSASSPAGTRGTLAERFSEREQLDLVSVAQRFLRGRPDVFQQLVVYTTRPLNPVPGTLAFQVNVANAIQGIGLPVQDDSRAWGSQGALESVVFMDSVDQYLLVDGFEFLAHEVGHRWLARGRFRDSSGSPSGALLGRGAVHWSFFADTQASVMEGNQILDRGGGRFETADVARRFSPLDQYLMGLRAAGEVSPFFYVAGPDDFRPNRGYKASSAPEAGVSFTGRRVDVRIEDVQAVLGPRLPAAAPPTFRQAFLLVADSQAGATDVRLAALARIRARFEEYFVTATDGRGRALSTLP